MTTTATGTTVTNSSNELRHILTNLSKLSLSQQPPVSSDLTNNENPSQQCCQPTVLLRRPPPTYKRISARDSLRAELLASLLEQLSTLELAQSLYLPAWLGQRIAWFYLTEFYESAARELLIADENDDQLVEKSSVVLYVKQHLLDVINKWLVRAVSSNPSFVNSGLFSFETPSRVTHDECGVKNKRRTMEDKMFVIENVAKSMDSATTGNSGTIVVSVYALFDGHCGVECAEFVNKNLPLAVVEGYLNLDTSGYTASERAEQEETFFKTVFNETNEKFTRLATRETNIRSGCTACLCLLTSETSITSAGQQHQRTRQRLHVAWCGDSQMCLVKNNRIHFLTDTHKPSMESERARIEQAGGFVTCASGTWRVNDTLAVSRSFGDCSFQASGLTCEPDVRTIELDGSEDYFILGCDGLFEHIAVDSSLSEFIEQALGGAGGGKEGRGEESDTDDRTNGETRDNNTPNIAELLVGRAKDNGSTDNISVIFVRLK